MTTPLIFLSFLLASLQCVSGWGSLGHRTVAYLAESFFTDTATQFVDQLLTNKHNWDISDASLWADKVKHSRHGTDVWHYIDAQDDPPRHCAVNYTRDCNINKSPGCVVSAITAMTAQMSDPDFVSRQEALMYLIHFIGDIHQPLHTENESRGGNDIFICFYKKCSKMNLHTIWDTEILLKHVGLSHHASVDEEKAAAKLWAGQLRANSIRGMVKKRECSNIHTATKCALEWAGESNGHICSYVLRDFPFPDDALGDDYYIGAVPIVEELIGKAGLRLGAWVNALAEVSSHVDLVHQSTEGEL